MPTYRYHWTPRSNLAAIAATGLDPAYANGKMRVVWTCEATRIQWAVGHVAKHHECSPDDMVLLRVRIDGLRGRRTSWHSVTVFDRTITPSRITVRLSILGGRFESIRKFRATKTEE